MSVLIPWIILVDPNLNIFQHMSSLKLIRNQNMSSEIIN